MIILEFRFFVRGIGVFEVDYLIVNVEKIFGEVFFKREEEVVSCICERI